MQQLLEIKVCKKCSSTVSIKFRRDIDGSWLCNRCYCKFVSNKTNNPKRIWFGKRRFSVGQNTRKGFCRKCGRKGNTDIHHVQYIPCMPIALTVELCTGCHNIENSKQEVMQKDYYFDFGTCVNTPVNQSEQVGQPV